MEQIKTQITVNFFRHGDNTFSVSFESTNHHADLTTYSYKHAIGHTANLTIYDMSLEDIDNLIEQLTKIASIISIAEPATKIEATK